MVEAHHLRQKGRSLSQSSEILGVSRATVHADLKLLDAHWDSVAELAHDDLLLDHIEQLHLRVVRLRSLSVPNLLAELGVPPGTLVNTTELTRLYAVHQQSINAATRELRLLLRELKPESRQRANDIIDIELLDDDEQLPETEQDWTKLNKPEHPEQPKPSKTLEILPQTHAKQNSAEHLNTALPRNTGRNKPCPCGSARKRKHCHPQSLTPPLEAVQRNGKGGRAQQPAA